MSQEVVNVAVPTGLNWNEHSDGSAMTVTGALANAASSFGFAKWVIPWKIGKYVITPSAKPARMIGLRPILSDSQPKTMKNGVPSSNATALCVDCRHLQCLGQEEQRIELPAIPDHGLAGGCAKQGKDRDLE